MVVSSQIVVSCSMTECSLASGHQCSWIAGIHLQDCRVSQHTRPWLN